MKCWRQTWVRERMWWRGDQRERGWGWIPLARKPGGDLPLEVISSDFCVASKAHSGALSPVYFTGCVSVPGENHFILRTVIEWSPDTFLKALTTSGFQNCRLVLLTFGWGLGKEQSGQR